MGIRDRPLALKELLAGGVDVSVGDNGVVQNFVTNNPDAKLRTIVDPTFEKEYYGFAVKKGRSDDLVKKINTGLAGIKSDGTYDKIYAKWFKAAPSSAAAPAAARQENLHALPPTTAARHTSLCPRCPASGCAP